MNCSILNYRVLWERQRVGLPTGILIVLLFLSPGLMAFSPQQNPDGVVWQSSSAEAWSGSAQANASGGGAHLAGAFDSSVDTLNTEGVTAYLGSA